ncbi:cyclic nucleotide-binding protein [bacterium (Candidatus Blackallbacteria) CG17_big_fil_post_rev_8_21_14_2_50_48_46]|uniref:Cyclic nucleotide-binding protein n=1 Tax=bacterium (Candidatus Blackallbacteria) CG17_big_fil_post_rev_8_21_14_2_50_48_46 TaxID=2014261 RepID=A0A2M7FX21_9BACT|nr:MAG: cyclic nucleotide-binding protein [bacterium (Candidatus Blackallbacteria) CG18_big_fil_WC_8_21_14_2_50_49_26]PIW13791.1 MAG: cyclic nucleotide-binding protein [bacterium (Candidatus Blackallbacteria) CG17_big_fil_post_rev_8_21_14_2_50_48_46]PIW45017.1 MAG: cyclic nucleotide-binding protein [bacterium (Candidatus Blackallbacteria) CG13_big_fil_rev_8_21_14_2_50_49_14]
MQIQNKGWAGDFWGGLAAMLVALPAAIAFGVTIFSAVGASFGAQGALAGILGAVAIGLVAAFFGGAPRLISAPCAPAAAVLTAFALEQSSKHTDPLRILLMMTLIGLLAGLLQVIFGVLRLGRLIKYMPYPVVSGYLSGVGLVIILSQVPKFLGAPKGSELQEAILHPAHWHWQSIAVGLVTAGVMLLAPKLTKAVPAVILALAAGILTYFGLGLVDPALWVLQGNVLVVGPAAGSNVGFLSAFLTRWQAIAAFEPTQLKDLLVPATTLAVLLSIDTLKTCVVLDSLTRTRHNSNRELIGQGLGNLCSGALGGIPGAGTMGATLVNISSGAHSRFSGIFEGGFSLAAMLALGALIAWVPIAALAAILIIIGVRMFDRKSLHLLKSRSTILDFVVILAVVLVAETISLIAASAVGIGLAIFLFIREQVHSSNLRRKSYGNQMFSKQIRLPEERQILEAQGQQTVIFELQGSLFFGTTDQLYTALEPDLKTCKYMILDMRRLQSFDVTAAHMLELIADILAEQGAQLIFTHFPRSVPTGQDLEEYFTEVGLVKEESPTRIFAELDAALEWVENQILDEARIEQPTEKPLELREMDLFKGRKETTIAALEACMQSLAFKPGERIFARGEQGDELFLIRRGAVRIELPIEAEQKHHIASFGRGDFFGEMSFLDQQERSADAVASEETELYVLSRQDFDRFADEHHKLAANLLEGLARVLSIRLRDTNKELRALQAS